MRFANEDGSLTDYDASLIEITEKEIATDAGLDGYIYTNTAGDSRQYIPGKFNKKVKKLKTSVLSCHWETEKAEANHAVCVVVKSKDELYFRNTNLPNAPYSSVNDFLANNGYTFKAGTFIKW